MDLQGYRFLLVLFAVIVGGITAAQFIIPVFTDDAERSRLAVARSMIFTIGARRAVSQYYKANQRWPENNAQAGLPPSSALHSKTVAALEIQSDGRIVLSFTEEVSGLSAYRLYLQPTIVAGKTVWSCHPWVEEPIHSWPADWLPPDCRP